MLNNVEYKIIGATLTKRSFSLQTNILRNTLTMWSQRSSGLSLLSLCVHDSLLLFCRRPIARTNLIPCVGVTLLYLVFGRKLEGHVIWSLSRQSIIRSCSVLKKMENHCSEKGLWRLPAAFTEARVPLLSWRGWYSPQSSDETWLAGCVSHGLIRK